MAQESSFSFHCMICFEEFHPEERFPVVLPCGHTYVCNACANRLDKCMECRMPLYTIARPPSRGAGAPLPGERGATVSSSSRSSSWANGRSGRGGSGGPMGSPTDPSMPSPHPPVKKRLPLPKNVVLLSLIEATELATLEVQKKYSSEDHGATRIDAAAAAPGGSASVNLSSRPSVFTMNSMIDADDDEEEKIRVGTSLAVGVAGTYAVATRDGLTIVPNRPLAPSASGKERGDSQSAGHHPEEDVDSLVQNIHSEVVKNEKDSPKKSASTDKDCGKLSFGDRVQVVSIDGGWAKLARGYGYAKVDRNSLVKGPWPLVPVNAPLPQLVPSLCRLLFYC
jgi:Zinc finger, C3HC4 type (RING finger)